MQSRGNLGRGIDVDSTTALWIDPDVNQPGQCAPGLMRVAARPLQCHVFCEPTLSQNIATKLPRTLFAPGPSSAPLQCRIPCDMGIRRNIIIMMMMMIMMMIMIMMVMMMIMIIIKFMIIYPSPLSPWFVPRSQAPFKLPSCDRVMDHSHQTTKTPPS
jgi:hypothetical protein